MGVVAEPQPRPRSPATPPCGRVPWMRGLLPRGRLRDTGRRRAVSVTAAPGRVCNPFSSIAREHATVSRISRRCCDDRCTSTGILERSSPAHGAMGARRRLPAVHLDGRCAGGQDLRSGVDPPLPDETTAPLPICGPGLHALSTPPPARTGRALAGIAGRRPGARPGLRLGGYPRDDPRVRGRVARRRTRRARRTATTATT